MTIGSFIPPTGVLPRAYIAGARPLKTRQAAFGSACVTELSDMTAPAECLCCPDTPCIRYADDEAHAAIALDVTRDPSRDVCVFGAIAVEPASGMPTVNQDACGSCGLCVDRCPAGAIAWSDVGTAVVQTDVGRITEPSPDPTGHARARRRGSAAREQYVPAGQEWLVLRRRFDGAAEELESTRLRLLVRNLLRSLGATAHAGVRGDTSDRTEIAFADGETVGVAEVGRYGDLLEGVRRVMTAVAVAHARRGIARDRLSPIVFMLRMPNQRTDGYELVQDLAGVLGLEVVILPIAALHLAVVASGKGALSSLVIAGQRVDRDPEALDAGPAITRALGLPLEAAGGYAFSPAK